MSGFVVGMIISLIEAMMVTFRRTYQVKFISNLFKYDLLLTAEKESYVELENEVKDYMKKKYRIQTGDVIIVPLELGIIEL